MDILAHLELGLLTAVSLENLGYAFLGCLLGTLIGVLPGLGPVPTIAMLLPVTYSLSPTAALIMLAGIYYPQRPSWRRASVDVRASTCLRLSSVARLCDGRRRPRPCPFEDRLLAPAARSLVRHPRPG